MDSHYDDGCLGDPIKKSDIKLGSEEKLNLLRFQWSYAVTVDGKRKARACIDGSLKSAPWLHKVDKTYSSCIEMPGMRMFVALVAQCGYIISIADTSNTYQQSPPLTRACYMEVDEAYASWYKNRFGNEID